jgi:hypothetical protein
MGLPIVSELSQRFGDSGQSFIPRDGIPSAFTSFTRPLERSANTIGIVEALKARNSFGAKSPTVNRMERVPNDIDGPSVDDPGQYPAAPHALPADGRNPLFNTGRI